MKTNVCHYIPVCVYLINYTVLYIEEIVFLNVTKSGFLVIDYTGIAFYMYRVNGV